MMLAIAIAVSAIAIEAYTPFARMLVWSAR